MKKLNQAIKVRYSNVNGYNYFRKEKYSIKEILDSIGDFEKCYDGDNIKMNSQRYRVFKEYGVQCISCGISGEFFAKETTDMYSKIPRYHFNLYGINDHGNEILMTKDHIIPRSKGGKNIFTNYQTMCVECNIKKKNKIEGE